MDARGSSKRSFWVKGAIIAAVVCVACGVYLAGILGQAEVVGATPEERVASVCDLADSGRPGAAGAIAAAAVKDSAVSVRRAALVCLGRFSSSSAREAVERCTRDPDPTIRASAALALGRYQDAAATKRLCEMADEDAVAEVRAAAVTALDAQRMPEATVALIRIMEKSRWPALRPHAAWLLVNRHKVNLKPDPTDAVRWKHLVEVLKGIEPVQWAFETCKQALDKNPDHIIPMPVAHGSHCGPNCAHVQR